MKARFVVQLLAWITLVCSGIGCFNDTNGIDGNELSSMSDFVMRDELLCTVIRSSDTKDIGKKMTFIGLTKEDVKVLFDSGRRSPMKVVHSDDKRLVFQLIASGSGSVDSFVIEKSTGKFSRAAAGAFAGVYAAASVGVCN